MAQNQTFYYAYQVTFSSGGTPPLVGTFTVDAPGTSLISGGETWQFAGAGVMSQGDTITAPGGSAFTSLEFTGNGYHKPFGAGDGLLMTDGTNYYVLSQNPLNSGENVGLVTPYVNSNTGAPANQGDPNAVPGVDFSSQNTYCFFPGTLISTTRGKARVEDLEIGDNLLTADGETRPVRWIGRQTVSTFFADKEKVHPIRISASSLGADLPERDLLVSPDHAILVDGVLVQASALINGRTITQETDVPTVFTWYHIETEDHSLILAEGTPAETFIDNVARQAFDNWAEYDALYPDAAEMEEMDLPRVQWARQLPRVISLRLEAIADERFGKKTAAA